MAEEPKRNESFTRQFNNWLGERHRAWYFFSGVGIASAILWSIYQIIVLPATGRLNQYIYSQQEDRNANLLREFDTERSKMQADADIKYNQLRLEQENRISNLLRDCDGEKAKLQEDADTKYNELRLDKDTVIVRLVAENATQRTVMLALNDSISAFKTLGRYFGSFRIPFCPPSCSSEDYIPILGRRLSVLIHPSDSNMVFVTMRIDTCPPPIALEYRAVMSDTLSSSNPCAPLEDYFLIGLNMPAPITVGKEQYFLVCRAISEDRASMELYRKE